MNHQHALDSRFAFHGSRVSLRSPGTRACEVAAREGNRWPSSYSRCQTAQCCSFPRRVVAPGFVRLFACAFAFASAAHEGFGAGGRCDSSNSVPPMRGDGAPTGALVLSVAPAKRDPLSRYDRDLSRRSTVAIFGCGPTKSAPGSGTEPQRLPAPSINAWRSGSGPPCVAVRAAARDATPCSVLQDRF